MFHVKHHPQSKAKLVILYKLSLATPLCLESDLLLEQGNCVSGTQQNAKCNFFILVKRFGRGKVFKFAWL